MNKKKRPLLIILGFIIILIVAAIAIKAVIKFTPSNEKADSNQVFGLEDDSQESVYAVVVDNDIAKDKSMVYEENVYINLNTVKTLINNKFYWDNNENILIFTTPSDVIKADVGSKDYYINKDKNTLDCVIVKTDGENVYVAAEFIKKYTGIEYQVYTQPNRICVTNTWGTFTVADVDKDSSIRIKGSIKSPIITDVKKGDVVTVIEKGDTWSKVYYEGGYIGYVKTKVLGNETQEQRTTDFQKPVYTSISKQGKINLVWHQVTNQNANNNLVDLTADTKGINVISPTWFAISDAEGDISSIADTTYVNRAHQLGYEVWALVADFSDADTTGELVSSVLPYTSKREALINQLISNAIAYNLDGLNIDFEYIKEDFGEDYIQFLRELSIKCRNNNIVLSVDNYAPSEWSEFYNREEQGEIIDYIVIMAYDEYTNSRGEAGPVASLGFVNDAITNTIAIVDPSKVIIGIPFYTRVWQETPEAISEQGETIIQGENGNYSLNSKTYGMSSINDIVSNKGLTKTWLSDLGVNYCEYPGDDGSTYKMWIEDEQAIEEKMKLINKNEVAGVASWKLGLENPDVWDIIIKYVN